MTLIDYQTRLSGLAEAEAKLLTERGFIVGATAMVASIKNRIIRRGLATDGSKIGTYSTKPAYFTRNQFIKKSAFKGIGQRGFKGERVVASTKVKFNKKAKKFEKVEKQFHVVKNTPQSMYLPNGYKQLREIQGRESDFVNSEYTGDTLNSLQAGRSGGSVVVGFVNERASIIRKAMEKRYGKRIYSGGKDDFTTYKTALNKETAAIIKQLVH